MSFCSFVSFSSIGGLVMLPGNTIFAVMILGLLNRSVPVQEESLQFIETVEVKQGEGCLKTFEKAKNPHPTTEKQCRQLLASIGRKPFIDERVPMMRVVREPVLYTGEQFVYVKLGNRFMWVLNDMN